MTRGFRDSTEPALGEGETVASSYQILRELARTRTGLVYEARDTLIDRMVALKLRWRDAGTPSLVSEARRCAAVRHPCSVQVYGMGMHQGAEYAVAERVVGRLLKDELERAPSADLYMTRLRKIIAAVTRSHESGIAVGFLSGSTVMIAPDERLVLGRLSLSQVPSFEPTDADVTGAQLADIFSLGSVAIEMAGGAAPLEQPPPRLADLRPDLPSELSDLVDWIVLENPAARPQSAADVLAQIDALLERMGSTTRPVRVLFVDDDTPRARWLWGLARRAHASTIVETASEGTDAAHKLNRDQPDLVFVDASLRGVMNALELCMYARGLASDTHTVGQLFLIGNVSERDQLLFADANVQTLPDDETLPGAVLERIRGAFASRPRARTTRTTVSG